jgi:23S rRNA pseudouridine1911/1915/1917 synthase
MEQLESNSDSLSSFSFNVPESFHGVRLDHYLVQALSGVSRSQITASIKTGGIQVDGAKVKAGFSLMAGSTIAGSILLSSTEGAPEAQPIDFSILHEDPSILMIDKPPGLVVHPGSGNRDKTLINGLLYRYKELAEVGDTERPGIVHRLDKDTSGVMVIARTRGAHQKLVEAFKDRQVKKQYLALVHGRPDGKQGRIVAPIGRHPVNRQKMAVRQTGGRYAVSNWQVRELFATCSLVEVHIETGRTHQIRVHMASIGHPVAGDRLYGPQRSNDRFPRQMLHAWQLQLAHPETGEIISAEAPLPPDFSTLLDSLEEPAC